MSEQRSDQPASHHRTTTVDDGEIIADIVDDGAMDDTTLAKINDATSIDVTRYKTDELKNRFQQLFGVIHLLPWAGAGLGGCMAVALLLWAGFFLPRATTLVAVLTFIYMGLQGFFLGIIAASLLVVSRVFQQLTAIVDITIQTLRQAFRDVRRLGDPVARAELTGALIHGAIIPTVQSVIAVKVGLLRMPVSFVINRVLGISARKLTKSIEKKALSDDNDEPIAADSPIAEMPDTDESPTHLDHMQERIELIARRTRRATLIPAALFFVIATGVSSIPWLVALLTLI